MGADSGRIHQSTDIRLLWLLFFRFVSQNVDAVRCDSQPNSVDREPYFYVSIWRVHELVKGVNVDVILELEGVGIEPTRLQRLNNIDKEIIRLGRAVHW
jgi:hypothetical protein